jgi:hypothetical protein
MRKLIAEGEIKVFAVDAAKLHDKGGIYWSGNDRLILYKGVSPLQQRWLIIHEVTHAVQDWSDAVLADKYAEADAYIAAATAAFGGR